MVNYNKCLAQGQNVIRNEDCYIVSNAYASFIKTIFSVHTESEYAVGPDTTSQIIFATDLCEEHTEYEVVIH